MSPSETVSNGLAQRFADLLKRWMTTKKISVTDASVLIYGSEKNRGHVSGYRNARKGEPTRALIERYCGALDIPEAEIEALFAERKSGWPEISSARLKLHREVLGRGAEVTALYDMLHASDRAVIVPPQVAVRGGGGMGKTTLARYYAVSYGHLYRGVWWVAAQSEEAIIADLDLLAGAIGAEVTSHPEATGRATAVLGWLARQSDPWLIIYDNAVAPEDVEPWLPDGPQIILTTREGVWPGFAEQEAGRLDPEAATDLLLREAERDEDREDAAALAAELDRLPLALVLAGGWLRAAKTARFDDYSKRLAEMLALEPKTVGVRDYPDSVFGAVSLSLQGQSPNAAMLMKIFAWLASDGLEPRLVTDLAAMEEQFRTGVNEWQTVPRALWELARSAADVELEFEELAGRSLLERGDGGYRVHRLTQAVQRAVSPGADEPGAVQGERQSGTGRGLPDNLASGASLSGDDSDDVADHRASDPDWLAVAVAMIAAGYPFGENRSPQYRKNWPDCARLSPHVAALVAAAPATAAMDLLLNQASIYLDSQRMDTLALTYSEEALRLAEARLGPMHGEVGIGCNNLAGQLWRLGRHEEAEAMAARAVEISEADPSSSRALYANYLSTHGVMADMVGRSMSGAARREKLTLATRRFQKAIAIDLAQKGRVRREVSTHLNNLADLRGFQGRWGAALRLNGRALAARREALPPDDPDLANSLHNLGGTLLQAGRAGAGYRGEGVLDLLEQALAVFEDAFDWADHPNRSNSANWLATAHWTLAEIGGDVVGQIVPNLARAQELCAAYGFEPDEFKPIAALLAERCRMFARGEEVPPMPGEGME